MKTVHKFQLSPGLTTIGLPEGAKVLHVAEQYTNVCIWVELDVGEAPLNRCFYTVPTGGEVPHDYKRFIGTVLMMNGCLVYHIYEV